jgi:hypothetical protein
MARVWLLPIVSILMQVIFDSHSLNNIYSLVFFNYFQRGTNCRESARNHFSSGRSEPRWKEGCQICL